MTRVSAISFGPDAKFTQLPMLTTYIYCNLVTDVDALMRGASHHIKFREF